VIRGNKLDRYVVDASVALAFVWAEADSAAARRLFLAAEKQWLQLIAPDFALTECANGCWKRVARRWKTAEEAIAAMEIIDALPIARIDASLIQPAALGTALITRTTCYDALYVATAQFADIPLVTADTRLIEALSEAHWPGRALHISQW
jgi:predicted nucleic acid-binding protein